MSVMWQPSTVHVLDAVQYFSITCRVRVVLYDTAAFSIDRMRFAAFRSRPAR